LWGKSLTETKAGNMHSKIMAIGLLFVMAFLSGCGAASIGLRGFDSSKAAYMRCLEQNPDDPSKCDALRQSYEADLRAFRETTTGLTRRGVLSPD
jgi:hypothetical protein